MSAIGELCSAVASWQRDGIGDADTIAARALVLAGDEVAARLLLAEAVAWWAAVQAAAGMTYRDRNGAPIPKRAA